MLPSLFPKSAVSAAIHRGFKPFSRQLALAVRYHKNGAPADVYKLETVEPLTAPLANDEVQVKFLAAPINPSDINLAEGVYGKKPALPAVGGNEGVAVVTKVGKDVKRVKEGDWVLPAVAPFGTWRQEARANEKQWIRVRNDIPAAYAAIMAVNMGTAMRLLKDYGLKPGDWLIQNGANSMVGLAVIQIAREMGIKTLNVVRSDRPDVDDVLQLLTNLGGDINIPANYLPTYNFQEILAELPPIKVGFNSVGGEVATDLVRSLAVNGTVITYGGMSKQPVSLPSEIVAQKKIHAQGFWISNWFENASLEEREALFAEIGELIKDEKLSFFYELFDLDDFQYALTKSTEPFKLRKVVLNLDYPDRFAEHDALPASAYKKFEFPQF